MTAHALKYLKKTRDQLIANAILHKRRADEARYHAATCKREMQKHFDAWHDQQADEHNICVAQAISFQDAINRLDPVTPQHIICTVTECEMCKGNGCVSDDPEVKGSVRPCAECNATGRHIDIEVK